MNRYYGTQIFDVVDGAAKLTNERISMDAQRIHEASVVCDNIWNADERLEIFVTKDGIGFEHEIPSGYSSYTYDPEMIRNFYRGATVDWFLSHGLDTDERAMLDANDIEHIRTKVKAIQGESDEQK